ncbi:TonB-dependent receptor [Oceanobacter sp. 4_MG-2023]|uniref:TonB-dependent receptor n=1 Tax=Oceanobacter sp. 4_MG-2023 TaxID=3062623 RepID=UPI002735C9EF|nr:TonB-dependent receptor [Oceanobacter sp. 4_MG-2023]MDP2547064.1 TonB-dependent receptor [Oceanobacter sp. 4_MG-2023]
MICRKTPLFLAVSAAVFTLPTYADQSAMEEVVVTADFRQTDVQSIPEATTVVGAAAIEQRSADHLESLLALAPNVNFTSGASRGRFFQIRGIGERSQYVDPVNPSVGLRVDGIDMTGLGGGAGLFDVQQVEVLRGPQGTRFGANALAGMINIESNDPTEQFEGMVSGKLGNYNTKALGAVVSGEVGPGLNMRLSAHQNSSDGYIHNAYLDRDDTNNIDEQLVRLKGNLALDERNTLALTWLYIDVDNGFDAFSLDNNRTTYSDNPGVDRQNTHAAALTWTSEMAEAFDLRVHASGSNGNTEYSYDEDWAYGEYDGTTDNICVTPGTCLANQGGYSSTDQYLRDHRRRELDVRLTSTEAGQLFSGSTDWVVGVYRMTRSEDMTRFYTWNTETFFSDLNTASTAVYGELSVQASDDLVVTTGVRSEQWNTDYDDSNAINNDRTESLWGGKVALEYLLNSNQLAYASLARGYKAGGVNTDQDISEDHRTFDTEFNNALEAGLKSSLLDDTLRTRVAAFYIQRKDQQVKSSLAVQNEDNSGISFQDYLANAAEGVNYGLELETDWALSEQLNWTFSGGWLQTKFIDYQYETADGTFSMNGREQAQSPTYSFANSLAYAVGNGLTLVLENEAKDSFYFSDSHYEESTAYVMWHARVAYDGSNYQLAVYGRNLTDVEQEVRGFHFGNDPRDGYTNERWVQYGDPRLVGVEGKYYF